MKKFFLGLTALSMLLATSCQKDADLGLNLGETSVVSFNVGTPQLATRAYSDGYTANKLQYAVYDEDGVLLPDLTVTDGTINGSTTVSLQLTTGNTYSVLFWAAAAVDAPYSVDFGTKTMTVDYNGAVSNDEKRDAFYKYHTFNVNGAQSEDVELKRPFAQLNIGTNDYAAAKLAGYEPTLSSVTVKDVYTTLNFATGKVDSKTAVTFDYNVIPTDEDFPVDGYDYLAMNYVLVDAEKDVVDIVFGYTESDAAAAKTRTVGSVPVQRNYRTNIYGSLLTSTVDVNVVIEPEYVEDNKYGVADGQVYMKVATGEEIDAAFADENIDVIILTEDIDLNVVTRAAADPAWVINKKLTIDLGGFTLSATSTATGKNYNLFDVNKGGALTVKNGTIVCEHKGQNMKWDNSTNIFNVTAGGELNLQDVTATNAGGSDMAFVAHLNNWGEVTLNVDNCTLVSTYVPVRVFNSGPDMNNVVIKNSTLKGENYAFWVHNYTVEDFGTQAKADAQKALLNMSIYNQGNKFTPDINGIRYGFTNSVKTDANGITKSVSQDGTEVILGSVVEDGVIRRGVAGDEENTTIKKVVVGEGVTTLYDRTFRRFKALETVELPSTLTTIGAAGSGVFQSCGELKNIVIPESVTVLGKGTFQECTSLEAINIPAGVTRIEENCLRNTGLVSVEFHENVTYFGAQAFRDCKQLKEVYINAPQFTIESNAFGIMSGTLPGTTIYVANAAMKEYLEKTLSNKNQLTIIAPEVVENAEQLHEQLKEGKKVVMSNDIFTEASKTAPYGNKYGIALNGGVLDGNGHELDIECYGDDYGIMTTGGTIKNLTIDNATRAIMIMYPTEDVIIKNVNIGGDGVLYPINTGEKGSDGVKLYVENSTLAGWTSFSQIESASFTNVKFEQGTYYNNIYGRVVKPYVNSTFTDCSFIEHMNIDLSGLTQGHKVVLKNCTVNGQQVSYELITVPSNDADYDTQLLTVDLPSWASSVSDCLEIN